VWNSLLLKGLILILSNSFLFIQSSFSQNLIPNPGFEELFISDEFQWVQPINQFYHWEQNSRGMGNSHNGKFFNGICMYNWHPCEYLSIKLSEPLVKDSSYHLSTWLRIASFKAKGHQHMYKIGAYFSDKAINTRRKFVMNNTPQAFFNIPDSLDKSDWNEVEATFTATGNEEYLTIGYFPALYFSKEEMKNYIPPKDSTLTALAEKSKGKSRKKKKKKKYKEKDLAEFRRLVNQKVNSERSAPKPVSSFGQFTLRYYFDDFCLAQIQSDGTYSCQENSTEFNISDNQTFRLNRVYFETGEATLIDSSFYELDRLSFFLSFKPDIQIKIIGHTDNIGKEKENLKLSEKRAKAVYDYLTAKGLKEERISFEGRGESEPLGNNETPEGRFINRRVEFQIISEN